ncbi:MAG: hypothetical protein KatS3mg089_0265 [Patescibacteria group bacterium]|nr:MAG: hypothetical protein KatS3mg089_0265 [Patescibacteria group bacterium]
MRSFIRILLVGGFLPLIVALYFTKIIYAQEVTPTYTPTPTLTLTPTPTEDKSKKLSDLQNQIAELEKKVSELQSQGKTLSSQIAVMDNQIKLTEYRISATRQMISDLTEDITAAEKKIVTLEKSVQEITKILLRRINETYRLSNIQPLQLLLSSNSFTDFIARKNYIRIVQANDKKMIYNTVQARNDYENQKEIFEGKKQKILALQTQLEEYTQQLDNDKKAKEALLKATQNDEKKYQELLAQARAEYLAIQGIVAGNGTETEVGRVSEGQRIASVISGASCNSSGGHLHFIVSINGSTQNPFNYLKSIDYKNCSGSSCDSGDGDPFDPSGSWDWPLNGPITFYQGYGETWAVRNTWVGHVYRFHNGIDITGSSYDVKAVRSGILYRGSYTGTGGCRLPYVRVRHDDGLDTFYLHVYY